MWTFGKLKIWRKFYFPSSSLLYRYRKAVLAGVIEERLRWRFVLENPSIQPDVEIFKDGTREALGWVIDDGKFWESRGEDMPRKVMLSVAIRRAKMDGSFADIQVAFLIAEAINDAMAEFSKKYPDIKVD